MRPLLALLGCTALLAGCGGDDKDGGGGGGKDGDAKQADAKPRPQLPGGGRRLFPDKRVVAFYGNPRARQLGILGIGTPASAARKLRKQAKPYARKTRPILPAFELIATIATAAPGEDGKYRNREPDALIRKYLKAARKAKALLILDIQPGTAPFGPEIEHLRQFLRMPDVGLALDPEWSVPEGQVPGRVIGSMDAEAVNATAAYLSKIVKENDLPEKLLLVHRFTDDMIKRDSRLRQYPGVRTTISVDGFGGRQVKLDKYQAFAKRTPRANLGFKLFYEEDTNIFRPKQVMAFRPRPDVVMYE